MKKFSWVILSGLMLALLISRPAMAGSSSSGTVVEGMPDSPKNTAIVGATEVSVIVEDTGIPSVSSEAASVSIAEGVGTTIKMPFPCGKYAKYGLSYDEAEDTIYYH